MTRQVAVCGPGQCTPAEAELAHEVGRRLAQLGVVVLTGGYGGVMEAAARGARQAGGVVVGVLSGPDRAGANPHSLAVVVTAMGEGRNAMIVRSADAVVVVGGSWGTLSELALAVRSGTPVVTLGGWSVLDADGQVVPGAIAASSAAEAIEILQRVLEGGR